MEHFYTVLKNKLANEMKEHQISKLNKTIAKLHQDENKIFIEIKGRRKRKPFLEPIWLQIKTLKQEIENIHSLSPQFVIENDPFHCLEKYWKIFEYHYCLELVAINKANKIDKKSVMEKLKNLAIYFAEKHDFAILNENFEYNYTRSTLFYYGMEDEKTILNCWYDQNYGSTKLIEMYPEKDHLSLLP